MKKTLVSKSSTLVGSKFMRKVAVIKASSQNFNGMEALASKAKPTSTM
jgi:hypothetical protein